MKTYLIYDGRLYKIGQTNDINQRMKGIYNANPFVKILGCTDKISEQKLHEIYKKCRVKLEWFDLSDAEVQDILNSFDTGIHKYRADYFINLANSDRFLRKIFGTKYNSSEIKMDIENEIKNAKITRQQWT